MERSLKPKQSCYTCPDEQARSNVSWAVRECDEGQFAQVHTILRSVCQLQCTAMTYCTVLHTCKSCATVLIINGKTCAGNLSAEVFHVPFVVCAMQPML